MPPLTRFFHRPWRRHTLLTARKFRSVRKVTQPLSLEELTEPIIAGKLRGHIGCLVLLSKPKGESPRFSGSAMRR